MVDDSANALKKSFLDNFLINWLWL